MNLWFLLSILIDTVGDGRSSDSIDYEIDQNKFSDKKENMHLSFVSKKYNKVVRGCRQNRVSVTTSTPATGQFIE
jgi:hypothetical protein